MAPADSKPAPADDWVSGVFPTAALARGTGLLPLGSRRRDVARSATARLLDLALAARGAAPWTQRDLDRAAERAPRARVTVLGIYQPDGEEDMARAVSELRACRHAVEVILGATAKASAALRADTVAEGMRAGKFANLNRLLEQSGKDESDWFLLLDDDVSLPRRFLDRLLGVAESLRLDLCQPAQTWSSHAAWRVTRRRPALARRTNFVETGPVTLLRRPVLEAVTPFSEEGMGWGQCLHWGALAQSHDWRLSIVDALAVRHERRATASAYGEEAALEAARGYLAEHDHISFAKADETLETFGRLPSFRLA